VRKIFVVTRAVVVNQVTVTLIDIFYDAIERKLFYCRQRR
jgi:hypothetical protein